MRTIHAATDFEYTDGHHATLIAPIKCCAIYTQSPSRARSHLFLPVRGLGFGSTSGVVVVLTSRARRLTLRALGQQVFPDLYLPVMTEANLRVLQPWRCYMPVLPAWWAFSNRMRRLNMCAQPLAVCTATSSFPYTSFRMTPLGLVTFASQMCLY